jgi:hypothetical protein
MGLIKLCPACGEENPVSEVICRVCMANLSSVSPTREGTVPDTEEAAACPNEELPGDESTFRAESPILTLSRASNGLTLDVAPGDELGRSGVGRDFFKDVGTVSRRHARVGFRDGMWWIEDLKSTNGTWLNGKRIEPGRANPLKAGDAIALSLACEMRVTE